MTLARILLKQSSSQNLTTKIVPIDE